VVVVPAEHVDEVLRVAEAGAAEERRVAAEVEAGRDFFEARGRGFDLLFGKCRLFTI
jgi:regulator of RNase E activity RraA